MLLVMNHVTFRKTSKSPYKPEQQKKLPPVQHRRQSIAFLCQKHPDNRIVLYNRRVNQPSSEKYFIVRTIWLVYEFSLSYHETTCTRLSAPTIVCVASKIDPAVLPMIAEETISSSLYSNDSVAAAFIAALISSFVTDLAPLATRIVVDPVGVGTR